MTDGPVVVLADEFDPELIEGFEARLPNGSDLRQLAALDSLRGAHFLVVWTSDVHDETIASADSLRAVVRLDSGNATFNAPGGVPTLTATSPALTSVAEHTVMLILAVYKRLRTALDRTLSRQWADGVAPMLTNQEEYSYNWVGLEKFEAVQGKTVGLVGLGRIGAEVARLLSPFNCDVVYTKRNRLSPDEERSLGVRFLEFDELLSSSSCVSLHNRFDASTEKMMGAAEFARMPPGSFLVNTARGRLVDEDALVAALTSGHLAGAAIDVAEYEPPQADSGLWDAPNLIITPHTAGIPIAVSLVDELGEAAALVEESWAAKGRS